ncbi:MAG: 4-(cytidine 5'-diphospho)-2-C-methyl-D-erythritol kinase [bacterium]
MNQISLRANAKINLFLNVLDRRPDGYHNIETIYQSISLHDTVTLRKGRPGKINIQCNHPDVPIDDKNIVYNAVKLMNLESGTDYGVDIQIVKRIPIGAGLAGGSADAAVTFVGLNELWDIGFDMDKLQELGSKLGADVPFCIIGGTCLGKGKGEKITKLDPLPSLPVVIANPGFQISTAWAYECIDNLGLTDTTKNANILIDKIKQGELSNISEDLFNIFEIIAFQKYPVLSKLKDCFDKNSALGSLMTGSGPTVFALAKDIPTAINLCKEASKLAEYCIVTKISDSSMQRI